MKKRYNLLMTASFTYGGFLLLTYLFIAYSVIIREEPITLQGGFITWRSEFSEHPPPFAQNYTDFGRNTTFNYTARRPRDYDWQPAELLISPPMLILLAGGLLLIANGAAIRVLTHEKEVKKIKAELAAIYLSTEEKNVIHELEKANGTLTQKAITEATGYSRVKVHRLIKNLESKRIVKKLPGGQTNQIILETETNQTR
jgi:uncharacterized membrane protein